MASHMGFIHNPQARYVVLRDDRGNCLVALPGGEQKRSDPAALRRSGWRFAPVSTDTPAEAQTCKDWWMGKKAVAAGSVQSTTPA